MIRLSFIVGLFTVVCTLGCSPNQDGSGGPGPGGEDTLREVGGLISAYTGEQKRGPQKTGDLARYEPGFPLGYEAVKSGKIVVVWGAKMTIEEGGGNVGTSDVVAYEKKVPAEGGLVLLQNGTVKQMTSDEFKSAPKAK